ncbi:phosphoribosylglycinamide formyltransferase [Clostridium botulinum]|uniref:Phosphoribosylglycinamide formyltransferase n=1 Tax=Clostridium botulinum C/D str. DC5 TaxID=1443128 RepID=A0A0A0IGG7_CLOBO|nr:phosphoribosylglycinamide formyltransferase [Clostridium botulinum]KGM98339.1 phosphoribosylglycinamide formyltransferase [Clostridium botulinum D str. CCUG 7971]KGN00078.1 phosphoribosylglycinamide formyltransferase [Clostridium botulinum C/D str. DC5]KOC50909.1 phosphoribosylglycinamide formyltransferase [Clostridium botulinum]KOC55744.1 phosphoribosylglycinamide formyltransferase [Clostridium botulinum]KOC57193.1 phosphoribosylglycinamide formyltransferase [Clostridium botulinum]
MFKIAVLVSGSGSNLQSIIDNIENENLNCNIEYVISDKEGAFGIERAKKHNIKTFVFDRKKYGDSISDKILETLDGKVDLIVLAGYLSIVKGNILNRFKNKIINIHPSLIPAFCGKGMYGIKVHQKALEYGVKVTGCTVHFVDEGTDTGSIILQKAVNVEEDDTPEKLQKRVLVQEHKALPEAIKLIYQGKIGFNERKEYIDK